MKNKYIAAALALCFGGLGANKFYLGESKKGVIRLLFCWTCIPTFLGVIEGVSYIFTTNEDFQAKHCKSCTSKSSKTIQPDSVLPNVHKTTYCPSCGAQLDDIQGFCPHCGLKIE